MTIPIASPAAAIGHTQPKALSTPSLGRMTKWARPRTPMKIAGMLGPPLRLIGPTIREPREQRPAKGEGEQSDPGDDRFGSASEHEEGQDERQDQATEHA